MNEWFFEHVWATYAIIFVLVTYVYNKVFRVAKLPLLKSALVYVLIAVGSFLLLIFQMFGLPIVLSLAVAVVLMIVARVRSYVEGMMKRSREDGSGGNGDQR